MSVERPEKQPDNNNNIVNNIVTRRTVVLFAVCVCAFLLVTRVDAVKNAFNWITNMLSPVFMGVTFAYIINPIDNIVQKRMLKALEKSKKMRPIGKKRLAKGVGVTVSVLVLIAVIALLLFLIIPEFLESLSRLIDIAPSLIEQGGEWLGGLFTTENTFTEHLGESIDTLVANVTGWIGSELSNLIGGLVEGAISVVSFVMNFLIAIVVCVYALLEKESFRAQSKKILYAVCSRERANDVLHVARYGNDIFAKFISGKLITSTIVGLLTFIFMSIMGMSYALLSAGILAITNVIPFFGPFIGGIPTAFIILLTNPRHGLIYVIFMFFLQQIEGNIIEPVIMEDQTGVSKFWVTVALLFCGGVFGLAGMIFSVPLFAVMFYVIKIAVERSLKRKGLPIPSADYLDVGFINPETGEMLPPPEHARRKRFRDAVVEWRARVMNKDGDDDESAE